jgi:hypothetical protein
MDADGYESGIYWTRLDFPLYPWRFTFVAREPLYFPPGKASNLLRGAFGSIFRRIACVPECQDVKSCELRVSCAYARLFEPGTIGHGPSGLADWPRPFVFRASHLDGRRVELGESFHFDLHVFETKDPALAYFALTFAQLAREGLGPGRGRAELGSVTQLDETRYAAAELFDGSAFRLKTAPEPLRLSLDAGPEAIHRIQVSFVTPTELKSGAQLADRPDFGVLFARIRDRVSTLRALYGGGPLEVDFRGLGERANHVQMPRCELRHVDMERRSSKSGQVHPLGGFVGKVEYEGELGEFLPWLRVAEWVGVGRQTIWGKGEILLAKSETNRT